DDLRTHVDKFIDKKQAAFKHLLMDQDVAFRLDGYDQDNAQKIRRESGPGSIAYRKNRTIDKSFYFVAVLCRYINIVALKFKFYSETREDRRDDSQFLKVDIFNGNF